MQNQDRNSLFICTFLGRTLTPRHLFRRILSLVRPLPVSVSLSCLVVARHRPGRPCRAFSGATQDSGIGLWHLFLQTRFGVCWSIDQMPHIARPPVHYAQDNVRLNPLATIFRQATALSALRLGLARTAGHVRRTEPGACKGASQLTPHVSPKIHSSPAAIPLPPPHLLPLPGPHLPLIVCNPA